MDHTDPLHVILKLSGTQQPEWTKYRGQPGSNISATGTKNAELMKAHNIKPGTPEWFQLWFSLPYLTGEPPV